MSNELKGLIITLGIFAAVFLLTWACTSWPEMAMYVASIFALAITFFLTYRFVMIFVDYKWSETAKHKDDNRIGKKW
jgi:membrane protein implicated in regulation of membrane protease activity